MISRSEKRFTRNGSTAARSSGPPRLKSTIAVCESLMDCLISTCPNVEIPLASSDGPREHGPSLVRFEIPIERHADVADEEPARRHHGQLVDGNAQQAVAHRPVEGAECRQFPGEIGAEVDAELLLDGGDRHV